MMTPPDRSCYRELLTRVESDRRAGHLEGRTPARHLARWWGPDGFTTTTRAFEFAPGGVWEFTMHGPDGTDYPEWIQWREIVEPERITMPHGEFADDPAAFESVLTFTPDAGAPRWSYAPSS